MSDAPREEEIYQALAPGGSYKSGLVNPVAAQSEQLTTVPMRFKGAMGGGAVGNEDYPDHEPRASVPYKHYKDLEDTDPKLHEAVTHVADQLEVPRTDLASLVYANSDNNPNARSGARTGYMGLTPDDARTLDPEGHLDINDPIDNLYLGAMKYKRLANRFGMGTPVAFAAYHGGGDTVNNLLSRDPEEHARSAPDGTFKFLNKVLGRDGEGSGSSSSPTADDEGAGGDPSSVESMAAAAQAGQQPQRFVPGQQPVPPMMPNDPAASAALTYGSLPSQVSPYRSYEGPPEAPRPADRGTYQGPPEAAAALARTGPYYPQEISRPQGAGAGRQPDASQPTRDVLSDREAQDRATPVPPPYYSRGRPAGPGEPNYDINLNAPPIAPIPPGQGVPGAEQLADRADYPRPPPLSGPTSAAPEGMENQLPGRPSPELTGQGGVLQPQPVLPERQDYQPPFIPRTSGGYAVGGAIPTATQGTTPDSYPGQPPALASQASPQATTGSGAPPAAPRRQAIGTDSMAAQLNQQELARVQGGRPDVAPTGPTQAPAAPVAPVGSYGEGGYSDNPALARVRRGEDPGPPSRDGGASVAASTTTTPTQQAPTEPGQYTAIGDSLAAHVIRKGGVRGQEDATKVGSYREGDTAVSGWGTQKVLELIDKVPLGQIQGQNVVLSTGASNSPADLAAIPKQIARLKELGAKSVSVLGVGTRPDFAGVNDKLAGFVAAAKDPSVVFAGALPNVGADKVHSTDPTSVFQSAQRALAGAAPTTGSAPTPTTAPGAGGGGASTGMPAANLPAGAPRALAPPGSASTPTSAPPIDRLKGSPTTMTATGVVRAAASGGPDGVLTYMTRGAPKGMSVGDGWNHTLDLLSQAMILKGDMNGLQHAQEYVFRMQHKGAMENLMQAIGNFDDPNAAAHFLAKSHAFVTDGTQVGFQVLGGQIYGQRYDEQTHDKIGKPFQITEQGLRQQAMANSDPKNFVTNLHNERTANETGRHNVKTEQHADEELKQKDVISQRVLEEKKIEFEITQKRLADQAAQRTHEFTERQQQRQDITDQQERVRKETQAAQHEQQTREKEKDRQLREDQAAERAAATQAVREQKAAEEKSARYKYADDATDEYFGRGGMAGTVTDPKNPNRIQDQDVPKARRMFSGILHHDKTINAPDDALSAVQGHLAGKYKLAESVGDDGKRYAHIRDENGNVLATVPADIWRMYLPKQGTVPGGTR